MEMNLLEFSKRKGSVKSNLQVLKKLHRQPAPAWLLERNDFY